MDNCCWVLEAYDDKDHRVSEAFAEFREIGVRDDGEKSSKRRRREVACAKLYVTSETTFRSLRLVLYGCRLRRLHEVRQKLNIGVHVVAGDYALLSIFVSVRERVAALRAESLYERA